MFHGVVEQLPEYSVYGASNDCQLRKNDFERAIKYCTEHFRILQPADLESYYNGTAKEDGILITFDDALSSVCTTAMPILQKYQAPATVFITTDWTNGGVTPAIFALEYALYNNTPATLEISKDEFLFVRNLDGTGEIPAVLDQAWTEMFGNKIAPLLLKDADIKINGKKLDAFGSPGDGDCWKPASWDMLRQIHDTKLITFGAHGRTHAPWTWLTDVQLENELRENCVQIKENLGIEPATCSYPHGLRDERTKQVVQKYFTYAFANNPSGDPVVQGRMNVPRYNVPYQRPNNMSLVIKNNRVGNIIRRIGSKSKLY